MKKLKKTFATATAVLMAAVCVVPAFASYEDEPDYSVTGDFPENVSVEVYGGADSEGLSDEYIDKYGDIIGWEKRFVVRISEKTVLNSDPMNEDVTYKELPSLDCEATFTVDYNSADCGVYFFNDATEDIEKINAKYENGKYTFKADTVYPGLLFLSKYELSNDETVAQQTLKDNSTGIKAEGKLADGTFMQAYAYSDDWTEYSVTFGRNFKMLESVDAKLYIPCENSGAKAGFMAYDDTMKFVDFGAKYENGFLVINTKDIPAFQLKDIFVGTDEEIAEYISIANGEGDEPTQPQSTEPSTTVVIATEKATQAGTKAAVQTQATANTSNTANTVQQGKSAVSTGDSTGTAIAIVLMLAALGTAVVIKKSRA